MAPRIVPGDSTGSGLPTACPSVPATVITDSDGRVTQWSPGASRLFGCTPERALGSHIGDLFGHAPNGMVDGVIIDRGVTDKAIAEVAAGRSWAYDTSMPCECGRHHALELTWEPMTVAGGAASIGVTAVRLPMPTDEHRRPRPIDRFALLNEAITRIGSTLDLDATARETADVAVPKFCDAAIVFVLEHLLEGDESGDAARYGAAVLLRHLASRFVDVDAEDAEAALPGDRVFANPADTPFARCMETRTPIRFTAYDPAVRTWLAKRAGLSTLFDYTSFLAVPLTARGTVLGVATFGRGPGSNPFDARDVLLAEELAGRAAVCIDNARLYTRERHTALALRQSLFPRERTAMAGLEIAHRYLPASGMRQVGGDWYDAIPLPGNRAALVIGDAMGHDSAAAAAMVQLRTGARTLADLDLPPGEVLQRLDRLASGFTGAQFATCLYASFDPATRRCSVANAGHVPPVLVHPDGTTTLLELPAGLPLGVGEEVFASVELDIPEGATLALCTDGLVENRRRDIDAGIAALRDALERPHDSLDDTCETVVTALHQAQDNDDVTLLLARILPVPA